MIRLVFFFFLALGLAAAGWWLASQTGQIVVDAFGREISMSLPVGIAGLLLLTLGLFLTWQGTAWAVNLPAALRKMRVLSRRERGYDALERALIASASGDTKGARAHAEKVKALMDRPALAGLLAARSAQADGDIIGAERHFEALLTDKRTRLAARRGLTETALQRHDHTAAIAHAKDAFATDPGAKWAFETLFDAHVSTRNWAEARETLDRGAKKNHVGKLAAARRRAVLLSAEASAAEIEGELETARSLAEKAVSAAPGFAPGAALAARLLVEAGKNWRAAGLLEDAWAGAPHPALALAYRDLKEDETPKARAKRMNGLAQINADHRESIILRVETALEVGELAEARSQLQGLIDTEGQTSSRLCTLMARLEKVAGNKTQANNWLRQSLGASDEPDWSDLDPEGPAFGYRAEDWARLVYSFGDAGELIHPRHERFERVASDGAALLLANESEAEIVVEAEAEIEAETKEEVTVEVKSKPKKRAKKKAKAKKKEPPKLPLKSKIKMIEPERQPDDPGPGAKADPTDSVLKRKRKVH
ncbi:MAG: heme biosynthesis protein HemY [Robiginitomaculum sp.]|nr:MAG: heme biosynthesis protein HemY [Robiginitomaculum sp.]